MSNPHPSRPWPPAGSPAPAQHTGSIADMLPEGLDAVLDHCGTAMRFDGNSTSWVGKPGHGHQTDELRYRCVHCEATASLTVKTPC